MYEHPLTEYPSGFNSKDGRFSRPSSENIENWLSMLATAKRSPHRQAQVIIVVVWDRLSAICMGVVSKRLQICFREFLELVNGLFAGFASVVVKISRDYKINGIHFIVSFYQCVCKKRYSHFNNSGLVCAGNGLYSLQVFERLLARTEINLSLFCHANSIASCYTDVKEIKRIENASPGISIKRVKNGK